MTIRNAKLIPVLITTTEQSVYFGYINWEHREKDVIDVMDRRHVWDYFVLGTDGHSGVYALALSGPQEGSKVGPAVEGNLRNIHTITKVTETAVKAFEKTTW